MKRHEDYVYEVAKKTKVDQETVHLVIKEFWKAVKYYLTHPLESKKGILLPHLGKFFIKEYSLNKRIESGSIKEGPRRELYKKILNHVRNYGKGQTKK
jgi:hypothetical protein